MKAIVQNGFGDPLQVLSISDVPKPILTNPNHVLVQVYATSVNTPDWASTLGLPYILRPIFGGIWLYPRNRIMGSDVAGIVEEVGSNIHHLQVGDEVFGSTGDWLLGAFAEYALVPGESLIRKPSEWTFEEAAGAVMSGITARAAIRDVAKCQPGMHILINGASGSIGTLSVQMAKADGAIVTGVCSTKNVDLVKSLGADSVIDYTQEDYTQGEEGTYDVILDNVLNREFRESAKVLKPKGFVIPNAIATERSKWYGSLPLFFLSKPKDYPTVECKPSRDHLQEVADWMTSRKMTVLIDTVYSMEDAGKAVAHMASHRARGQIIIRIKTTTKEKEQG